mmetsp:Transcript_60389/g.141161  ORF Transcript_60389/g.141161 Transcript_60389/m.141161 type:complete len:875 (+) Transcript_60389:78-2702(+)
MASGSANSRLKYRIVKCTSEEPEFPVSELLSHSQQTKGWQTARFCEFPQEVCLQFDGAVQLRQVQFLSHQSKIATKIELFTGMPPPSGAGSLEAVQFKRLGYLSLDSNERSQFQARELKSVYVDVVAQFLRILFHKCHANRYNALNQVGLIALSCLGEVLGPADLAAVAAPATTAKSPSGGNAAPPKVQAPVSKESPARAPPDPPAPPAPPNVAEQPPTTTPRAQPTISKVVSDLADLDATKYDAKTLERLKSLVAEKQQCVETEDYGGAKRCKDAIVMLKQKGLQICELEAEKRSAVENEEYDVAKALKADIDRLRSECERAGEEKEEVPVQAPAPPQRRSPQPQQRSAPCQAAASRTSPAPPPPAAPRSGGGEATEASVPSVPSQARRARSGYRNAGEDAPPLFPDDTPGPPVASVTKPAPKVTPRAGGGDEDDSFHRASSNGRGYAAEEQVQDSKQHPLAGVPNVEDLGQPDPIPTSFQAEAEPLGSLFGSYIIQCLYSKLWSLRDAALQKLALQIMHADGPSMQDIDRLLAAYVTILVRTIPDKNVQVFHSSAVLLKAVCVDLLGGASFGRPRDLQASLEPLLFPLVERLGDANARVEKTARDAHLDIARSVNASFAAQHLLRPPKKKTVPPRVFCSRLQLLTSLVTEFGVQPKSQGGLVLEPVAQLAMDWFSNPAADVRESAVRLIASCYVHVGLSRIEKYLANLRQAQREVFDTEFHRVSGVKAMGPPREPTHAVPEGPGHRFEEPSEEEDSESQGPEEFFCQFCGREDPNFTLAALDIHYWRECPMLSACKFCEQVIEISRMHWHLMEECEAGEEAVAEARRFSPERCPLCFSRVCPAGRQPDEQDWQEHLLVMGCPSNPRGQPAFR